MIIDEKIKSPIIILAVIMAALLLGRLSLPAIGCFLVSEDEPPRSDIIVVLMGQRTGSDDGSAALYLQGFLFYLKEQFEI